MSIAPIPGPNGFGVTPGFGSNPAYGVAAGVPRTTTDDLGGAGSVPGVQSFGQMLSDRLMDLSGAQKRSDALAIKAATGDLEDIHEYTIAAAQAGVATSLVVNVRNKAVESFNEIMRMQL